MSKAAMLPGALGAYGYSELQDQASDDKSSIGSTIDQARQDTQQYGSFQPWSVKSTLGSSGYNPNTGYLGFNLSGDQYNQQQQLIGGAQDMYSRAMQDPTQREDDIYNRIREIQRPDEQRAYDSMNANLFGSGRGGMSSASYGGSPEQHAFGKAQAEARNQAAYSAMNQGQQEMMNYGNMGNLFQRNQYMPMNQLSALNQQGLQGTQIGMQSNQNMANMLNDLTLGELGTKLNYSNVEGNNFANMISAISPLLQSAGGAFDQSGGLGGLWDKLGGLFGGS